MRIRNKLNWHRSDLYQIDQSNYGLGKIQSLSKKYLVGLPGNYSLWDDRTVSIKYHIDFIPQNKIVVQSLIWSRSAQWYNDVRFVHVDIHLMVSISYHRWAIGSDSSSSTLYIIKAYLIGSIYQLSKKYNYWIELNWNIIYTAITAIIINIVLILWYSLI